MREYATIAPQFWTGETGRTMASMGRDAQVVAFYLLTCPSSNMIGLYYLPLGTLCEETGIPSEGAREALLRVAEAGFAHWDETTKTAWVPEMARFQVGESIGPKDNRRKWIENEANKHRKCRFYKDFIHKYATRFSLTNTSPLPTPSEGASDPLRSQEQEKEQDQEKDKDKGKSRSAPFQNPTAEEVRAYCAERKNSVNAEAFIDNYDSKGWKIGTTPMLDWKAAVRTWERRDIGQKAGGSHANNKPSGHMGPGRVAVDQAALDQDARRRAAQKTRSDGEGPATPLPDP